MTKPAASTEPNLVDVLRSYEEAGFGASFRVLADARLKCGKCQRDSPAAEVRLLRLRRFEGESDPADEMALAALECPQCGARGTTVFNYGPGAPPEHAQALGELQDERRQPR